MFCQEILLKFDLPKVVLGYCPSPQSFCTNFQFSYVWQEVWTKLFQATSHLITIVVKASVPKIYDFLLH